MDRRVLETALLAALAVAAIAAGAATLPSTTDPGAGGGGGPPVSGDGGGGLLPTPTEPPPSPLHLPDLGVLATVLVLVVVAATVLYVALYRRELLRSLAGIAGLLAFLVLLFWLASFVELDPAGLPAGGGWFLDRPAGAAGDGTPSSRPIVLLVVVGVVVAGAVALLVRSGRLRPPAAVSGADEPTEEAAAVGEAAGRAADRIEASADLDNEIVRAWREMTGLLDVPAPGASTPGEFAAAAVEAGMDRDDVAELTRLFEDVRYGGEEPTAATERRSLSILRRIEAAYAPDEEPDGGVVDP